jgi:hypothetical protein
MKKFVFIICTLMCPFLILGNPEGVAGKTDLAPKKALLYYRELSPNNKVVIILKADKKCKEADEKISVEEFEVVKFYHSATEKRRVPVKVKNLYVERTSVCQTAGGSGVLEKKIVVGPFKYKMTHIRLITPEGINVSYAPDCGVPPEGYFYNDFCTAVAN